MTFTHTDMMRTDMVRISKGGAGPKDPKPEKRKKREIGVFHAGPPRGFHANAPIDAIKAEFGRVLQKKMIDKNWNQSDLSREAARHMPDRHFGRDTVSQYVRGVNLPGTVRLKALAKALGCEPTDLLPMRSSETADSKAPPLDMRDLGDGTVWLRVNQAVPQAIALKIVGMLLQQDDK